MSRILVSNETVFQTDWAAAERRAAIAAIRPMKAPKRGGAISGAKPTSVWMTDVSAGDRRSVKAWLHGRGDGRVLLWQLKSLFGFAQGDEAPKPVLRKVEAKAATLLKRVFTSGARATAGNHQAAADALVV
jgi:hypothetical protein